MFNLCYIELLHIGRLRNFGVIFALKVSFIQSIAHYKVLFLKQLQFYNNKQILLQKKSLPLVKSIFKAVF